MSPPRAASADNPAASPPTSPQTPDQIAALIHGFLEEHEQTAVLEDGKLLFDLRAAKHSVSTDHGRCSLHLWSGDRNLVRSVVSADLRGDTLRLSTLRPGHPQPKLMELVDARERRTVTSRESARLRYVRTLERVLARNFSGLTVEGFRAARDLERSFGPAYARGMLTHGNQAWAVIGVAGHESAATVDGILTLGILWLHHCREHSAGRRLFQGLKVIVPRGSAQLTLSRMAWLNPRSAAWKLFELDEQSEELATRDLDDRGNLRTRLIHHPDPTAASERFALAVAKVLDLVPAQDHHRVEQRLRSTSELAFLLHGLQFARARIRLAPNSFASTVEIIFGAGDAETPLSDSTREEIRVLVADLFDRRRAAVRVRQAPVVPPHRRIGAATLAPAHSRLPRRARPISDATNSAQDPLYRAAPERWLESVLRQDLAPLTRSVAPQPAEQDRRRSLTDEPVPDDIGNRADSSYTDRNAAAPISRVLPHLDPRHVYAQVPAIAGASDRGLLDLLGVTADGRLAVLELKADDDLHFALQGLDYWIRVRHHHLLAADAATGLGEFHRHGYFTGVELSPLPPRLYLVAPALRVHPATETVLRYLSPEVEWHLLALDERWRQHIRVIWRRSSARL